MENVNECKVECMVKLSHDMHAAESDEYHGVIHLFEQAYSENLPTFWYGVVELESPSDQCEYLSRPPVSGVRVHLHLKDGRKGLARYIGAHWEYAPVDGSCMRLAVVGITALSA